MFGPAMIWVTPPLVAYEAVPSNDPVNPAVAITEVRAASEPDTMTRFQFGILYLKLCCG